MNLLRPFFKSACVLAIVAAASVSLQAQVTTNIFNDSFADGDLAATGADDTNWWTSSSSSGIEISAGSLGLVTGTSGRGIHTTFATQTLGTVGDMLIANYTFTTPDTIGSTGSSFRVGMFDTLGRNLDQNISASSGSPSPLYGDITATGGTTTGIPGYMIDMDVNGAANADITVREHDVNAATGRLMATTSGFNNLGTGPDAGYVFTPNTEFSGQLMYQLVSATEIEVTGTLFDASGAVLATHSEIDIFDSASFGFLGFHVNSNTFGSTGSQGEPDNGLDFTNINVDFKTVAIPEPSTLAFVLLSGMGLCFRRRR